MQIGLVTWATVVKKTTHVHAQFYCREEDHICTTDQLMLSIWSWVSLRLLSPGMN